MNFIKKNNNIKNDVVVKIFSNYKENLKNELKNNIKLKKKYNLNKRFHTIFNEIFKFIPIFLLFYNSKIIKILKFARYFNTGSLFLINLIKIQSILYFKINLYSIRPRKAKSFRELMVLNRNLFNKLITNPKRTNKKTFFGKVLITKIKLKQFYNTSIPKLRKLWSSIKSKKIYTIFNFIRSLEMSLKVIIYRLGVVKTMQESKKLIKNRFILVNNKYEVNPLYFIKNRNTIIKFKSNIKMKLYNKLFYKLQNFQLYQKNLNEVSEFNIYNLSFIFFKKDLVNFIPPPLKKLSKPTIKVVKKYVFKKYKREKKAYRDSDRKKNAGIESYIIAKP